MLALYLTLTSQALPTVAVVCWESVAEDTAARTFADGFYSAVAYGLKQTSTKGSTKELADGLSTLVCCRPCLPCNANLSSPAATDMHPIARLANRVLTWACLRWRRDCTRAHAATTLRPSAFTTASAAPPSVRYESSCVRQRRVTTAMRRWPRCAVRDQTEHPSAATCPPRLLARLGMPLPYLGNTPRSATCPPRQAHVGSNQTPACCLLVPTSEAASLPFHP